MPLRPLAYRVNEGPVVLFLVALKNVLAVGPSKHQVASRAARALGKPLEKRDRRDAPILSLQSANPAYSSFHASIAGPHRISGWLQNLTR